jgi:formyl-CoA transferase
MGEPGLAADADYNNDKVRSENRDALNTRIGEITATRSSADWVAALNDAGVPCGPINNIQQVFEDPQVQHLGMAAPVHHPELGDINVVGQGVKLGDTPFTVRTATPEQGEHSDQILRDCGYDEAAIAALRQNGTI